MMSYVREKLCPLPNYEVRASLESSSRFLVLGICANDPNIRVQLNASGLRQADCGALAGVMPAARTSRFEIRVAYFRP